MESFFSFPYKRNVRIKLTSTEYLEKKRFYLFIIIIIYLFFCNSLSLVGYSCEDLLHIEVHDFIFHHQRELTQYTADVMHAREHYRKKKSLHHLTLFVLCFLTIFHFIWHSCQSKLLCLKLKNNGFYPSIPFNCSKIKMLCTLCKMYLIVKCYQCYLVINNVVVLL